MTEPIDSKSFDLTRFDPGRKAWRHIRFAGQMRVPVTLPIAVARGRSEGPTVLAVALVHGDEFEGPAAIADFVNALDVESLSGTFIGLPLTNPWAYAGQTRNTPDHFDALNLARQFPGDLSGSRTQQHAALLFDWVTRTLSPADLFVDFHSAGTRYEYASMVGYHPTGDATESASLTLARAFGFQKIWQIPDSPAARTTFNGAIARAGIPTIGTEVRGLGGLREPDVASLVAGLRNLLAFRGLLPDPPDLADHAVHTSRQLLFSADGLFRPTVNLEDTVATGQPLGRVVSLEGEVLQELTAPVDGHIWAIRRFASVHPDDIAFLIAHPPTTPSS